VFSVICANPELGRSHNVVIARPDATTPKKILKALTACEVFDLFAFQQRLGNPGEPPIYGDEHPHQFHMGRGRGARTPVDEIDLTLRTDPEIQGEFLPAVGTPHVAGH
jgi:hypothetical protein